MNRLSNADRTRVVACLVEGNTCPRCLGMGEEPSPLSTPSKEEKTRPKAVSGAGKGMPVRFDLVFEKDFPIDSASLNPTPGGDYVLFGDYQLLAERLEELEKAVRPLCALAEQYGPLGTGSPTTQKVRRLLAAPEVES